MRMGSCCPKPRNRQMLGEGPGTEPSLSPEKESPADTLMLDLQPAELWDNSFLLFKLLVCAALRQPEFFPDYIPSRVLLFSCSFVSDSATPWTAARQGSLSITISWSLPKLMSVESVMPSNHLILCRPFLLLPSIFPSIRVFSNESALHIGGFPSGSDGRESA